ncbi:MAG: hypothetical protein H5T44_05460 [Thermoplasmatales archaeon]|nr:hypothetical protein [Thermoplasmatales archaeon]
MKGYSISIKQIGDKTVVEINGNLPEEEIERIKKRYKDAEIFLNGKKISGKQKIVELETRKLR